MKLYALRTTSGDYLGNNQEDNIWVNIGTSLSDLFEFDGEALFMAPLPARSIKYAERYLDEGFDDDADDDDDDYEEPDRTGTVKMVVIEFAEPIIKEI